MYGAAVEQDSSWDEGRKRCVLSIDMARVRRLFDLVAGALIEEHRRLIQDRTVPDARKMNFRLVRLVRSLNASIFSCVANMV